MSRWTDAPTVIIPTFILLAACAGSRSDLPIDASSGPNPTLPQPDKKAIPTVNVAPAKGWGSEQKPTAAAGFAVASYAAGLDHPRWLYVLPNGDVLVAETNAPAERPEDKKGIKGFFMKKAQAKAGAGVPSPDRISLLRDADGDGKAEVRSVFLKDLYVTVGSNSNIAENGMENEERRAAIVEIDTTNGSSRVFATGLRNPNGMDWQPQSG